MDAEISGAICVASSIIVFISVILISKYFGDGIDAEGLMFLILVCTLLSFLMPAVILAFILFMIGAFIISWTKHKK